MKIAMAICVALAMTLTLSTLFGTFRTGQIVEKLHLELNSAEPISTQRVRFDSFDSLPQPVSRYFRAVLKDGQDMISGASFRQSGRLRSGLHSKTWMNFTAAQEVSPVVRGFVWDAKIKLLGPVQIRVLDSYIGGVGSGMVRLLSALTVGEDRDRPELNSGALHRYLAEAVWYPTALLSDFGVLWTPIDGSRALATLTDRDVTVSLEFRFNEKDEVSGIFTPGRWGAFEGGYKQVAWEGRFHDYQEVQGMRVPSRGEVGWYDNNVWEPVWQGNIVGAEYRLRN